MALHDRLLDALRRRGRRVSRTRTILGLLLLTSLAALWGSFAFGKLESTVVIGDSMEPAVNLGDRLIVYHPGRDSGFEPGDVVVVQPPGAGLPLLKRVAALPGDEVICFDEAVFVNKKPTFGELVVRDAWPAFDLQRWVLEEDQYFVLGDNRETSVDSTAFGPVRRDQILGVALLRIAPLDRFGAIGRYDDEPSERAPRAAEAIAAAH